MCVCLVVVMEGETVLKVLPNIMQAPIWRGVGVAVSIFPFPIAFRIPFNSLVILSVDTHTNGPERL